MELKLLLFQFRTCTPIEDQCDLKKSNNKTNSSHQVYVILEQCISFFLPFIIIIFCYICICSKIFNLKKIRTIRRHFSRKQLFKTSKTKSVDKGKDENSLKDKRNKLKNKRDKAGTDREIQIVFNEDNDFAQFSLSKNSQISGSKQKKTRFSMRRTSSSEKVGFYDGQDQSTIPLNSSKSSKPLERSSTKPLQSDNEAPPIPARKFHVNPESVRETPFDGTEISEVSHDTHDLPKFKIDPLLQRKRFNLETISYDEVTEDAATEEPPKFQLDPSMQRNRFNFLIAESQDDEQFGECPEPDAVNKTAGIIASSITKIEKHYNAIESAREEIAKKMRVYKYQIRVARTAIVICTLFLVCYIPYVASVLFVVLNGDDDCGTKVMAGGLRLKYVHLFLFINSASNVIIYGMMHRTVRAQVTKIIFFCQGKHSSNA